MWKANNWACRRIARSLGEYLDGTLLMSRRRKVEAHVRVCAGCRHEMETLRRTLGLLAGLPKRELSADFDANLQARLAAVRAGRPATSGFSALARPGRLLRLAPVGAVAVAVVGVTVWRTDTPPPAPKRAPAYVAAVVQEHQGLGMAPDLNATVVSHNLSGELLSDVETE